MKRVVKLILAMFLCMSMGATVFAAEIKPTDKASVSECHITFLLDDKTKGIFTDEIKITLFNVDSNDEYNYTMTSANYLLGSTVGGKIKQGNYKIAVDYGSKQQFTIRNKDGAAISTFTANCNEYALHWEVVSNDSSGTNTDNPNVSASNSSYVANTGDKEADALWSTFIEKVSVIETDSRYSQILEIVHNAADFNANYYAKATKKSKDEYLKMSPYEQFLWYSTYILPVDSISSGDYETYCSTVDKWNSNTVGLPYHWLTTYGTEEMADAYKKLMEWDYNYFVKNGQVMNFMTGKQSNETSRVDIQATSSPSDNEQEVLQKNIKKEIKEDKDNKEKTDNKDIWGKTKELVRDHAATIIVLLLLVGATIVVIVYRKRKTIDNKNE